MSCLAALNAVDWNFPRAGTDVGTVHSAHWFPGNFIPQIPASLIEILCAPHSLVLDPFCGSGTTAVEALRLGRNVLASDVLEACVLITSGKIALQSGAITDRDIEIIKDKLIWKHECVSGEFGAANEGSDNSLSTWFSEDTLAQLRYLWKLVEKHQGPTQSALKLIFSDTLFACASPGVALTSTGRRRKHHWGWVADNVRPTKLLAHDAIGMFEGRLNALRNFTFAASSENASVSKQDVRQLSLRAESVDAIITSPPYVGMIDYAKANRLLYAWMGWPLAGEREREIGARFKRKRIRAVSDYLEDMHRAWQEIHRVMKPGAFCALVIGESRAFPGTALKAAADLETIMPKIWGPCSRTPSRRRVSDRAANPANEQILIFQKA